MLVCFISEATLFGFVLKETQLETTPLWLVLDFLT